MSVTELTRFNTMKPRLKNAFIFLAVALFMGFSFDARLGSESCCECRINTINKYKLT